MSQAALSDKLWQSIKLNLFMAVLMLDLWDSSWWCFKWRNSHWRYPDFLRSKEIAHNGLTELIVVDSMHERKTKMNDVWRRYYFARGFGTLEEFFEMLTWLNLDFTKPIAVLNTNGFYDALIVLLETMVKKGF
jgi:predicted Rossmann-fold nucleotide-binding protein